MGLKRDSALMYQRSQFLKEIKKRIFSRLRSSSPEPFFCSGRLTSEFKERNSSVPWGDIAGLRNKIVHDYGNVDLCVVFDALKYDIPFLRDIFSNI